MKERLRKDPENRIDMVCEQIVKYVERTWKDSLLSMLMDANIWLVIIN